MFGKFGDPSDTGDTRLPNVKHTLLPVQPRVVHSAGCISSRSHQ